MKNRFDLLESMTGFIFPSDRKKLKKLGLFPSFIIFGGNGSGKTTWLKNTNTSEDYCKNYYCYKNYKSLLELSYLNNVKRLKESHLDRYRTDTTKIIINIFDDVECYSKDMLVLLDKWFCDTLEAEEKAIKDKKRIMLDTGNAKIEVSNMAVFSCTDIELIPEFIKKNSYIFKFPEFTSKYLYTSISKQTDFFRLDLYEKYAMEILEKANGNFSQARKLFNEYVAFRDKDTVLALNNLQEEEDKS